MTVALSLFIASLACMAGMIYAGLHKMRTGKEYLVFNSHKSDYIINRKIESTRNALAYVNMKTASLLFHFILDKVEGVFVRVKNVVYRRIQGFLARRKGNVEKVEKAIGTTTRKTASFFITHIKEQKHNWKKDQ